MNKLILAAIVSLGTIGSATAQTTYYYGNNGYLGNSQRVGNSTYYYDNRGYAGNSQSVGNNTYYYGNNGYAGSSTTIGGGLNNGLME